MERPKTTNLFPLSYETQQQFDYNFKQQLLIDCDNHVLNVTLHVVRNLKNVHRKI